MVRAVMVGLISLFMATWMPGALLSPAEVPAGDHRLLMVEQQKAQAGEQVDVLICGKVETMDLEDYLVGVVLGEMPATFHKEALKAQAVAARTFSRKQMLQGKHETFDLCADSNCCQAWLDPDTVKAPLDKIKEAIKETEGSVLCYEGRLIDAVYFSCSGGRTEDAVAVWGSSVPYLQPVDSPGEEYAAPYTSEVAIALDAFRETLPEADLDGAPWTWFGDVSYTVGGGVDRMEIGGISYKGTELRKRFGLNSTMFQTVISSDGILFEVKGFGHRVGMSQYGANAMAQAGKSCLEILAHYYPGTEIHKKCP